MQQKSCAPLTSDLFFTSLLSQANSRWSWCSHPAREWVSECVTTEGVCCSSTNVWHHCSKVLQCYSSVPGLTYTEYTTLKVTGSVKCVTLQKLTSKNIQHPLIIFPSFSFSRACMSECDAGEWYCSAAQPHSTATFSWCINTYKVKRKTERSGWEVDNVFRYLSTCTQLLCHQALTLSRYTDQAGFRQEATHRDKSIFASAVVWLFSQQVILLLSSFLELLMRFRISRALLLLQQWS